ncbi:MULTISPECIES: RNA repair transcriptional activator RtcR [unclassified Acinetobacter]|uniref:RNA repair transcriptional activator RtcR n=1 Tax=unclassified Acinetobacter TaxID=196816 RepID=UPI0025770034|nr:MULTISPECIES: RNA repair transcriptional activator RtcR [unclassified Acinetobacter]MDM1763228.1 sigma 54-interacting transcriptional regulator [Acinetobacter sp. 226-1]MDM1766707.1 sigma 54-interacting transcriptional regulator [Acinetobacter sp. 226-4]
MQKSKKTVVIGFVGSTLDQGKKEERWQRWRPTMSLLMHEDLLIDELVLLHDRRNKGLIDHLQQDAQQISPNTHISGHQVNIRDPWDFSDMYGALYDFVKSYPFDTENNHYLLHITTGTHVAQICWYLLVDAHYLPAKLIQSSPTGKQQPEGEYRIIDLDLSRYAALNQRFENEKTENWQQLKANIATKNQDFNQLIQEVELVATRSKATILIMGATGVGKSHLAKQIYQLKKEKFHLDGRFIDVNCATLCGDGAMSTLFGHIKGSFTGAANARTGYLKSADGGILFLDEIGELGLDEQAMLLKALEDKSFFPVGSDKEVSADFQLIAGTNKDLREEVQAGRFREDLWARLNTWTFFLPSLKDRVEDIAPNIEFELQRFATQHQSQLRFHSDALEKYLKFAQSYEATWQGNFRDLTASVTRMATLAEGSRIGLKEVEAEIQRLQKIWSIKEHADSIQSSSLRDILTAEQLAQIDEFDRIQLEGVIEICRKSKSMADAGRRLFSVSREQRQSTNDSDRVKKYLAKFGLSWGEIVS